MLASDRGAVLQRANSGEWIVIACAGSLTSTPIKSGATVSTDEVDAVFGGDAARSAPIASPEGSDWGTLVFGPATDDAEAEAEAATFVGVLAGLCRITVVYLHQAIVDRNRVLHELETIVDHVPSMIWFKDIENRMLRVNRRVAESLGTTKEAMAGQPAERFYEHASRYHADDQAIMASGQPKLGYEEPVSRAGDTGWLRTDKIPVVQADGTADGIIVIATDVTEERAMRAELHAARSRVDHAIEGTSDGLWDWKDVRSDDVWHSPQYARLLGFEPGELEDRHGTFKSLLHPDDHTRDQDAVNAALDGTADYDIDVRLRCKNGTYRWFQARGRVFFDGQGEPRRMAGSIRDVQDLFDARQAAEERERELRLILDSVPAYVYYKDDNNKILNLNEAAATAMALKVEDVRGRQTEDFFPAEDAAAFLIDDREVLASGTPKLGIEEPHHGGDGSLRYIRTDKFPLPDGRGGFDRLVAIATDMTDLRESERLLLARNVELQEVLEALNATRDAVLIFDRSSWKFVFANEGALQQLGRTNEEITSIGPVDIKPEFDTDGLAALLNPLTEAPETAARFRTVHRHRDGHDVPVELSVRFIPDLGEAGRFIAIARDISDTLALERRLEQRKSEMERFLYTASHDLKSPLVTILGFTGHLEADIENEQFDEIAYYSRRIRAATSRMRTNVDDLLELSRIGRTQFRPTAVDMARVVDEVLEQHTPLADERGATLERDDASTNLWIDERHLVQLLDNLVGNALKYGIGESDGRVMIGADRIDNEWMELSVADHGPGIDEKFAQVIFEPFRRLDGGDDGTGIGLAIVRRIAELYGGRAWIESTDGSGATFKVRLRNREGATDGD